MKNTVSTALFIVGFGIGIAIVGCTSERTPEIQKKNQETLTGDGLLVGTMRDGREIRQFEINRGSSPNHFIYIITGSKSDPNASFKDEIALDNDVKHHQTVSVIEDDSHIHVVLPRQVDKSVITIDGKTYQLVPTEK